MNLEVITLWNNANNTKSELDVHGSVRHNTNHIEITDKMQPCTRIYYSVVLKSYRNSQQDATMY